MKRHLEPLAIAANITQASFCRLDEVLLTFGYLVMQYQKMQTDADDAAACASIIASIEKRWAVSDQEIFVAAVLLNPFYRNTPFAPLSFLNNAGIRSLFVALWKRFYRENPPDSFYTEISDYLGETGIFENLKSEVNAALVVADRQVCSLIYQLKVSANPLFILCLSEG